MNLSAKFRMIKFMSKVDNYVSNLIEFTYGHAQHGEPCHRTLERTDTSDDYSLSFSERSNPKSVYKDTLIRKERRPDCKAGAEKAYEICACDPPVRTIWRMLPKLPIFCTERITSGNIYLHLLVSLHYRQICNHWKDSDTRNRCDHPNSRYRDPLLDALLTSLSTNTTYQN